MPDDEPAPAAQAPTDSDADSATDAGGTLDSVVFLVGLLAFLGSAVAYLVVLATGGDVRLPLAVNGLAALVVVAWTARDTYADPDSEVTTLPGALGTALLMLGAYGLVASVAVALSSPWHDRFDLAIWFGIAAAVLAVFGFFTFPAEVVTSGGDEAASSASDHDEQ